MFTFLSGKWLKHTLAGALGLAGTAAVTAIVHTIGQPTKAVLIAVGTGVAGALINAVQVALKNVSAS